MKTTIIKFFSALIFLFISCAQENIQQDIQISSSVHFTQPGEKVGNIYLPTGTKVQTLDNGSSVNFTFPEGVELVTEDPTGNLQYFSEVTYSCTCSSPDGGCVVLNINSEFGCLQGQCPQNATCTGGYKKIDQAIDIDGGHLFIDKLRKIDFLREGDTDEVLFNANPLLEKIPEVRSFIEKIKLTLKEGQPTKIAVVTAYGTRFGLDVPLDFEKSLSPKDSKPILFANGTTSVSCLCNSGDTGCELSEGAAKGGPHYCIGGSCQVCSMTIGGDNDNE